MLRIDYRNPMAKTYQYEYALYKSVCGMFHSVSCTTKRIETLKLHYIDLVTDNSSGNPSYKKQNEMEETMRGLVNRDLAGKIHFPQMHECRAEVKIKKLDDESDIIMFTDGVYAFTLHIEMNKKKTRAVRIHIRNYRVIPCGMRE